jgi:hypothetical protein
MKPSTGAAVRLHRNAVRDRPDSLSAFKRNACPLSAESAGSPEEPQLSLFSPLPAAAASLTVTAAVVAIVISCEPLGSPAKMAVVSRAGKP